MAEGELCVCVWGGGLLKILGWHTNIKTITEFQEFHYAIVVFRSVENHVNMRVKACECNPGDVSMALLWRPVASQRDLSGCRKPEQQPAFTRM